jgi:hypothetical protein
LAFRRFSGESFPASLARPQTAHRVLLACYPSLVGGGTKNASDVLSTTFAAPVEA